ncbi:MAG: TIGR02186 family protein [Pseudomonadota bacterium]
MTRRPMTRRPMRRRIGAWLGALAVSVAAATSAGAPCAAQSANERVIASLSQNAVGITTDFSGSRIFVFGAVERNRLADERDDDLNLIIAITGPQERVILRKKARRFGVWVNTESVEIDSAPSFYTLATTGPMKEILTETSDLRHRITIKRAIRLVGEAQNVADPRDFSDALVRLRRRSGVYSEAIGSVDFTSGTLFQTSIQLPANIIEGDYEARVYLLRDGRVLDDFVTGIEVRKVGLERWIYNLAHENSLLYGFFSIFVALFAGWAASETFRLLRR